MDTSFLGNMSGPCPRCGKMGYVIANGTTIDVISERVTVKRGKLSAADMAVIAGTLRPFQSPGRSKKAITEAIVKVLPELEAEVRGAPLTTILAILSLIMGLFTIKQTKDIADSATVQTAELIQEVRELRKQLEAPKDHATQAPQEHKHAPAKQKPAGNE